MQFGRTSTFHVDEFISQKLSFAFVHFWVQISSFHLGLSFRFELLRNTNTCDKKFLQTNSASTCFEWACQGKSFTRNLCLLKYNLVFSFFEHVYETLEKRILTFTHFVLSTYDMFWVCFKLLSAKQDWQENEAGAKSLYTCTQYS